MCGIIGLLLADEDENVSKKQAKAFSKFEKEKNEMGWNGKDYMERFL
jgi:hypothetical protein